MKGVCEICKEVAVKKLDKANRRIREMEQILMEAKKCIDDAIYTEDGLDGGTGEYCIRRIRKVLRNKK